MFTGAAFVAAVALWSVAATPVFSAVPNGNSEWVAISNDAPLRFGTVAGPSSGTVDVTPDGLRTAAGVFPIGTDFSAAVFTVISSGGNHPYTIGLPPFVDLESPTGATMRIDNLRSIPAFSGRTKPPGNIDTFSVGGTLHVSPAQAPGSYSGHFEVMLNF